MHLLNTVTGEVSEVPNGERRKYAILSHTWGLGEITFQELSKYHKHSAQPSSSSYHFRKVITSSAGYQKIQGFCNQAKRDGYDWVWIDTCCIDKRSSAELSEAINSMFKWYQESDVCYVYLSDVMDESEDFSARNSSFRASRWFGRGWTLQELLAPRKVLFYSCPWKLIGELTPNSGLCDVVSEITSIPPAFFEGALLSMANIAQRMSWASKRKTTREEDIAYCLLGIFDVKMPLLYGEGAKAFRRLQEEIMKYTNDHTLLAWGSLIRDEDFYLAFKVKQQGALATSPADFESCNDLSECPVYPTSELSPYQMTNLGLQIKLPLRCRYLWGPQTMLIAGVLNCFSQRDPARRIAIPLMLYSGSNTSDISQFPDGQVFVRRNRELLREDNFPPNQPFSPYHTSRAIFLAAPPSQSSKPEPQIGMPVPLKRISIQLPKDYEYQILFQSPEVVVENNRFTRQPSLVVSCPYVIARASAYFKLKRHKDPSQPVFGRPESFLVAVKQSFLQPTPTVLLAQIGSFTCLTERDLHLSEAITADDVNISVHRFNYGVVLLNATTHFEIRVEMKRINT